MPALETRIKIRHIRRKDQEEVILIIIEGIGIAFCYDRTQIRTVMQDFTKVHAVLRPLLQIQMNEWTKEFEIPEQKDGAPPRLVLQDIAGEFLVEVFLDLEKKVENQPMMVTGPKGMS